MIRVRQVNQTGAGIEEAVVPALEPQAGRHRLRDQARFGNGEEHELAGEKAKALVPKRLVHRATEGHELRFDSLGAGNSPPREKEFLPTAACGRPFFVTGGETQTARASLLL